MSDSTDLQSITDTITEDEALTLVHSLRRRFDWTGTEFMRGDIESAIEETDDPELGADRIKSIVDAAIDSYEWRKMPDRLAEVGNEIIADLVAGIRRGSP